VLAPWAGVSTPARADSINMSATHCMASDASQGSLSHGEFGVKTELIGAPVQINCSVLRSALNTNPDGEFEFVGIVESGETMKCVLTAYSFTGVIVGTESFETRAARFTLFDVSVFMPQLTFWDYTALKCLMPKDGKGTLISMVSKF
jgi:hypothetical protein